MAIGVGRGGTVRADKVWKNVGTAAGVKDVIAAYGQGPEEAFVVEFSALELGVPIQVGQQVTTAVYCVVPADVPLGLRDALVGVGEYNAITGDIAFDDYEYVPGVVEVWEKELAGEIPYILKWHEGLTYWETTIPDQSLPWTKQIYLAPAWINNSDRSIVGHVDLSLTWPDGTTVDLVTNEPDKEATPGNGYFVPFEPFTSSQSGTYTFIATLTTNGQILHRVMFTMHT